MYGDAGIAGKKHLPWKNILETWSRVNEAVLKKIAAKRSRTLGIRDLAEGWRRECPDLELGDFLIELYLLRLGYMLERVQNQTSQALFGLRSQDMRVLFALRRSGPPYALRPTDLFRSLFVTSGAITKQVDRLIDRGMVERVADEAFRGGFLIRLTTKGKKLSEDAIRRYAAEPHLKEAFTKFTAREKAAAKSFCLRLLEEIESEGLDATGLDPSGLDLVAG